MLEGIDAGQVESLRRADGLTDTRIYQLASAGAEAGYRAEFGLARQGTLHLAGGFARLGVNTQAKVSR
jgi:hypothetical protein